MKKYKVIGILSASIVIGEYEAENEDDALLKANEDGNANWGVSLCHHCASEVDIGDIYETQVEEIDA